MRKDQGYRCRLNKDCDVNKNYRNRCQYCRLQKCLAMGMRSDTPRTNPQVPNVKTSVSIITNGSGNVKPRVVTPELPTVPCPMVTEDTLAVEEDESQAMIEEEIKENNKSMNEAIMNMLSTVKQSFEEDKDEQLPLPKVLLTRDQSIFTISKSSSTKFINIHFIGEVASRVLFSTVHWVRQLSFFSSLHPNNQTKLMKRCWLDLFVLGLAQCQDNLHLDDILAAVADNVKTVAEMDQSSLVRVRQVTQNVCKLKEYISAINKLDLSNVEFGLLKIIALFNSYPTSINAEYYEAISDKALTELRDEAKTRETGLETRYSKILLRLSPLRSLHEDVFEEIFFGGLIGNVQVETVVPILLKMNDNELLQYLKPQS